LSLRYDCYTRQSRLRARRLPRFKSGVKGQGLEIREFKRSVAAFN
jgi:hypothetical protein